MRSSSIRVWNFRYDLFAIIHREYECFIVLAVCTFIDVDATRRSNSGGSCAAQLIHIELHMPLCHLVVLVGDETTTRKVEKLFALIPWHHCAWWDRLEELQYAPNHLEVMASMRKRGQEKSEQESCFDMTDT